MKSKFIVVEGLEGAGKSTAIQVIADELAQHAITEIVYTREPGGTTIAEKIRDLIKTSHPNENLTATAELLLMYAARVQLVETVIKPALQQEKWVIGDRHDLSSQAYQGGGRGISLELITQLKQLVLQDFKPDLIFYLDIPAEIGLQRARKRGELDRFELESLTFFNNIRRMYLKLIQHSDNVIEIDASQPIERVADNIRMLLRLWLDNKKD